MFEPQEIESLFLRAWQEADMLIIPRPEDMTNPKLALEFKTRHVVFSVLNFVFNNADILNELISHLGIIPYKNQKTVYDAVVYLAWQERIYVRYRQTLIERAQKNPIAGHTLGLSILERKDAMEYLIKTLMEKIKFPIPEDEKESLIDFFLGEWAAALRDMPFEKMY